MTWTRYVVVCLGVLAVGCGTAVAQTCQQRCFATLQACHNTCSTSQQCHSQCDADKQQCVAGCPTPSPTTGQPTPTATSRPVTVVLKRISIRPAAAVAPFQSTQGERDRDFSKHAVLGLSLTGMRETTTPSDTFTAKRPELVTDALIRDRLVASELDAWSRYARH
jgi:hypothetical protein